MQRRQSILANDIRVRTGPENRPREGDASELDLCTGITIRNRILEQCKEVHRVDLGESFQTHIYVQNLTSMMIMIMIMIDFDDDHQNLTSMMMIKI